MRKKYIKRHPRRHLPNRDKALKLEKLARELFPEFPHNDLKREFEYTF